MNYAGSDRLAILCVKLGAIKKQTYYLAGGLKLNMKKRELRAVLSVDLFTRIDKIRSLYGGVSRSAIVGIAVKQMFDREMTQKETAPTQEAA